MNLSLTAAQLIAPTALTPLIDVRKAPRERGIYAWWFKAGSLDVPDAAYSEFRDHQLLYVGIAPRRPTAAGKHSASRLRPRLITHATKVVSRSTLRLSLGALLADELELSPRMQDDRVSCGADGELRLTRWMEQHAQVSWVVNDEPWYIEDEVLEKVPLALNLDGRTDAFAETLSGLRQDFRRAARQRE